MVASVIISAALFISNIIATYIMYFELCTEGFIHLLIHVYIWSHYIFIRLLCDEMFTMIWIKFIILALNEYLLHKDKLRASHMRHEECFYMEWEGNKSHDPIEMTAPLHVVYYKGCSFP